MAAKVKKAKKTKKAKLTKKARLPQKKAKNKKAKPKPKRAKKPRELEPCEFCGVVDEDDAKIYTCPKCRRPGCIHCMPAGTGVMCPECEDKLNAEADAKADEPPEPVAEDVDDDAPIADPAYAKSPAPPEDEEAGKAVDAGGEGEPGSLFNPCGEEGGAVAGTVSVEDDGDKENE